jgi:hypothetical protein
MPPRAAKKTKTSGEAKKASAPPKSKSDKGKEPVEDSEDEGDDEEDEDEEDLDGSDGYDDLIMVRFPRKSQGARVRTRMLVERTRFEMYAC